MWLWTFRLCTKRKLPWIAEQVLASEEGLWHYLHYNILILFFALFLSFGGYISILLSPFQKPFQWPQIVKAPLGCRELTSKRTRFQMRIWIRNCIRFFRQCSMIVRALLMYWPLSPTFSHKENLRTDEELLESSQAITQESCQFLWKGL